MIACARKGRTITTVTKSEADGIDFVTAVVSAEAEVHADEATHWDALNAKFRKTLRINHTEAYSKDGDCTNQVESFLLASVRWWKVNVITSACSICTSTRHMPLGWRITSARTTAGFAGARSGSRWRIL